MILILQMLISIVVGVISAMLTARLALTRFRSQRWWEKKADAYSAIVGSMLDVLRMNSTCREELVDAGAMTEEKQFEMQKSYTAAMENVRHHALLGDFFISELSSRLLRDLLDSTSHARDSEPLLDYLERSGKSLREALKRFRLTAKADLEALVS